MWPNIRKVMTHIPIENRLVTMGTSSKDSVSKMCFRIVLTLCMKTGSVHLVLLPRYKPYPSIATSVYIHPIPSYDLSPFLLLRNRAQFI